MLLVKNMTKGFFIIFQVTKFFDKDKIKKEYKVTINLISKHVNELILTKVDRTYKTKPFHCI